jgi:hypothetical protein
MQIQQDLISTAINFVADGAKYLPIGFTGF